MKIPQAMRDYHGTHIDTWQKVREYLAIDVLLVLVVDPVACAISAHRHTGPAERYRRGEPVDIYPVRRRPAWIRVTRRRCVKCPPPGVLWWTA